MIRSMTAFARRDIKGEWGVRLRAAFRESTLS